MSRFNHGHNARRDWIRRAPFAAALAALLACHPAPEVVKVAGERVPDNPKEVLVAAAGPWLGHPELRLRDGLVLATEQVNARGGIKGRPIRLLFEEDSQTITGAISAARRIVANQDVAAVVGHLQSYTTVAAAAVYDLGGLVHVSPSAAAPELTGKGYTRLFRTVPTDAALARAMAEFAANQGYRRVAIYYLRTALGRTSANAFEEQATVSSVRVVRRASYDPDQMNPDVDAMLAEWNALDLQAIFLSGQLPAAGNIIGAFRRRGIDVPILGVNAMNSEALLHDGGQAANGTVVPTLFEPTDPAPHLQRFMAEFRARFTREPDAYAALSYDAMMMLAAAIAASPTLSSADIARTLHESAGWAGVTGLLSFDSHGDLRTTRSQKMIVRKGRFEAMVGTDSR